MVKIAERSARFECNSARKGILIAKRAISLRLRNVERFNFIHCNSIFRQETGWEVEFPTSTGLVDLAGYGTYFLDDIEGRGAGSNY